MKIYNVPSYLFLFVAASSSINVSATTYYDCEGLASYYLNTDTEPSEAAKAYAAKLTRLRSDLTKAQKIDEARAVDAELTKIQELLAAETPARPSLGEELCRVTVSSSHGLSVHELKPKVERLSGGYRPIIEKVDKSLEGAKFTRVPWQTSPKNEVTAKSDGIVYVFSISKRTSVEGDVEKRVARKLIAGPWLKNMSMYRVRLRKGQSFTCSGGECAVIAKDIDLK